MAVLVVIPTGAASASADEPERPAPGSVTISNVGLPSKFKSWDELFKIQHVLDDAASRIRAMVERSAQSGFANVYVDAETNSLTLYWRGQPSGAEARLLDSVRGEGITVRVRPARFSQAELDQQVELILRDFKAQAAERLAFVTKQPDGSGIEVGVFRPGSATPDLSDRLVPADLGRSLPNLQRAVGMGGVTVVESRGASTPYATREHDTRPYYGGAVVFGGPGGIQCTSGFSVHWPAVNGRDYLTTASHCEGVGQTFYTSTENGGLGTAIGVGTSGNAGYDLMFIQMNENSDPWIYTGAPAWATPQGRLPVRTSSHTNWGDWLCVSGAITGWACSLRATGPTVNTGYSYLGQPVRVEGAISSVGQIVAGWGDSGAPVWLPINGISNPNSGVNARGIVQGAPHQPYESVCRAPARRAAWPYEHLCRCPYPAQLGGGTRLCSDGIWFTDLRSAIQPWVNAGGMYVETYSG
jgi:hypothetical protein